MATSKTCTNDGCLRKATSRGMCSSHYSVWHRKRNGSKRHAQTCKFCGNDYTTTNTRGDFCSVRCAKQNHYGWSQSKEITLRPAPNLRHERETVIVPSARKRWFSCVCRVCGTSFVAVAPYRHCSDDCTRATRRTLRRANAWKYKSRAGKFAVSPSVRLAIYERDGWACQLCGKATSRRYSWEDPMSPTLDHIVPQSRQLVPDHSPGNLRLSCARCNALRGDASGESLSQLRQQAVQFANKSLVVN